ncbi:Polyketide-type polyunsaturated fatty acid synthase [Desulfonema limicola]|uniref:Polyketide-type polyunsaturated fatty acid synthase n=1 Tax=Desulfonema limicola TaxID=45656 RepID=A0A975B6G3_9BACT|nr:type I polyketide synthase [Desulfonema limicola]QTA79644.1 Polyketide-type polyunsaturated fatty acid synthase [Desulfonema limicola]
MKQDNITSKSGIPVAIVGMGCFFPKASGLKEYWRLLSRGQDAIDEVPETHWSPADYYDKDPKKPDHVYCKRGGFLSPVPFDPSEFGIPPTSLEATDTSQLLGLLAAKTALEDAGYGEDREFNREQVSVILGVTGTQELVIPLGARLGYPIWQRALEASGISPEKTGEVIQRISDSYVSWQESSFPGLLGNVIAGRISNRLDLGGTNCAVDAACASSMSAMYLALMEIQAGRSDMVVTGGVDCLNDIFMHMCFSKTPILSPTGDVRPFSNDADGSILGEGVGILIFKALDRAEKDGDRIYAVIKGLGTSSDGKSNSIYAPRAQGQIKALKKAYEYAGISTDTIELVEAHGTGTRVGDEVEFSAIKQFYTEQKTGTNFKKRCAIGSVKSMIGHTKAAAGAAGVIKNVLALYNKVLPPTLKINDPDPRLDIDDSPFYLNTLARPWISNEKYPRRSAVSSFGFGGSNFHMVIEEYQKEKTEVSWDGSVEIIAFSGDSRQVIQQALADMKAGLENGMSEQEISARAFNSRAEFNTKAPFRILVVLEKILDKFENPVKIISGALKILESDQHENSLNIKNIFFGGPQKPGELAFIFPGQGSQYVNMGRELVSMFPEAMEVIEKANKVCDTRISDFIYPYDVKNPQDKAEQETALRSTDIAQPAIGAVSTAMMKILNRFGIKPDAACGHSFGELTALLAGRKIDLETFFKLAFTRGRLMAEAGRKNAGTMTAVRASLDKIDSLIKSENLDVVLANRNSPDQGVLSGSVEAIERAEQVCRLNNISTKRLPVSAAFHSRLLADAQKPFADVVQDCVFKPSDTMVLSNITAEPYPDNPEKAKKLLGDQILSPVDFVNEIKNLFELGIKTFVEVGPKSVLTSLVKSILTGLNFNAVSLDFSSGKGFGISDLARLLCYLAALGHPVEIKNWETPLIKKRKQRMSIPISGANYRSEKPKPKPKPKPAPFQKAAQNRKQQALPEKQAPVRASINPGTEPDKKIVRNIEKMKTKNQTPSPPEPFYASGHTSGHASGFLIADAFKTVQEGLKSMQALQMETAETHKKFLETQSQASRTLQEMIASTRHLAEFTIGHKDHQPVSCTSGSYMPEYELPKPDTKPCEITGKQSYQPEPLSEPVKNEKQVIPDVRDFQPLPKPADNSKSVKRETVESAIIEVVSELTGYPPDMLTMDMDIEADLGIDSIKRVEILSAFEEKMPGLPPVSPEIMGTLKTLGEVVDHLMGTEISQSQSLESQKPLAQASESFQNIQGSQTLHNRSAGVDIKEIENTMLAVVSELTGYPPDMLTMDMDIEADLGIDSIKRVEILSAFEEKMPGLPPVSPEIMGTLKTLGHIVEHLVSHQAEPQEPDELVETLVLPDNPDGNIPAPDQIEKTMIEVVSSLTGYPPDMLTMDMDIEADLGIDSIKKVEILSAFEERMPKLPPVSPEIMGTLKTLGHIVEYLVSDIEIPGKPAQEQTQKEDEQIAVSVKKKVISLKKKEPGTGISVNIASDTPVFITQDNAGLGKAIADEFNKHGINSVLAFPDSMTNREDFLSMGGLIIIAGAWEDQDDRFLKQAFALARDAGRRLQECGKNKGAIFGTISSMDGAFGFKDTGFKNAYQGGLAGLAKTASIEWPSVCCHALDIAPDWVDLSSVAESVISELLHKGAVEIGLDHGQMLIPELVESSYHQGKINLCSKDVVIVTGGARGVTAAAALALAREVQPTLILIGRSPVPYPEPSWLLNLSLEGEIKKAVLENELLQHSADDNVQAVTPVQLEKAFKKIQANREISANLEKLKDAGSIVRYFSADVREPDAVKKVFEQVRREHGQIRALIHGAGTLEDRFIIDKTDEQFEKVFDTKVKGFEILIKELKDDQLNYLILFSSIAARTGNKGQADYAVANEVLNKRAVQESLARPECRVISFNWGPWDGGMVSPALKREFTRNNIQLIPIDQGAVCMISEMTGDKNDPVEVVIGSVMEAPASDPVFPPLSVSFKRELNLKDFPILRSHVLDGKPVLPFALIAEWLGYGALHENPGLFLHGLDDMRLLKGILLEEDKKLISLMSGKARRNGLFYEVDVELRNGIKSDGGMLHSKARAILADTPSFEPPAYSFPADIRMKSYSKTTEEVYNSILFHGVELQGIQEIMNCSPRGMVAKVSSAPSPDQWMTDPVRTQWISDPLVLDSAFQMAIVWCYENKGMLSLPIYSAAYRQYQGRFPSDGVTAILEVHEASNHKMKGDFIFLDSNDKMVARLTGYEAVMDKSLFKAFKR